MLSLKKTFFILFLALTAGCAGTEAETKNPPDATDAADATDDSDTPDPTGATDNTDTADPTDAADATDDTDAADPADAADPTDATDAADPGSETTPVSKCRTLCQAVDAAGCENDVPGECDDYCDEFATYSASCQAGAENYFDCIIEFPMICDEDGIANPEGGEQCEPLAEAYIEGCMEDFTDDSTDPSDSPDVDDPSDPDDTPTIPDNCSADCNGSLVGVPNMLCTEYNSSLYQSGYVICTEQCTADLSQCVEATGPSNSEFQLCSGTGQGNCSAGLECVTFDGIASYCVTPCQSADDTTTCGSNECVEFTSANYCLKKEAQRDAACIENLKTCVDGAGECTPTGYDQDAGQGTDLRCKLTCDIAGDGSECPADESCLTDPLGFGSVQQDEAGNQVTCTDATAATVCDAGFECVELSGGVEACFKRNGLCGTSVPPCLSAEQSEWAECIGDDANLCAPDDGHAYCANTPDADDGTAGAFAMCVDMGGAGLCFAFCEGTENDLNCGEGAQCVRPDEPIIYLDLALDTSGDYVSCSSAADCAAYNEADDLPFDCIELTIGSYCSRALKMCINDAEAASMSGGN